MTVTQLPRPETDQGLGFEDLLDFDPGEGFRTELLEGRFVVSPPPFIPHLHAATNLHSLLLKSLTSDFDVVQGPGVFVTDHNYFIPDLVVIAKDAWSRYKKGFQPDDVLLAVEVVSPSSRRYDNMAKREAYAKAGIKHYWIVDPRDKTLQMLELGPDESYVEASSNPVGVKIEPSEIF